MTPDTAPSGPPDPAAFRRVLGSFCSGITVVAAVSPAGPVGLTCQSFSSLSIEPPLVLFSPARTSTSWPAIRAAGRFCVSILAEDQQPISAQMSRPGGSKFDGVAWDATPLGSPRLAGAVGWLDCTLRSEYDGGDHTVVIGDVHSLAADLAARPLLYHQGRYAGLATS